MAERKPVYYSEYLQLDKILEAQAPESAKHGVRADDEMLFIVIHQAYELWFKQILHEVELVREIFAQDNIDENSPDINNALKRLQRITIILQVLVDQISIMESMTPLDFLDFRDFLRPASGFQSIQFKIMEALLGLPFDERFGQEYYLSQLNEKDVQMVKDAEKKESLFVLIEKWLARMPFTKSGWENADSFWLEYKEAYAESLGEGEQQNVKYFDKYFLNRDDYPEENRLSMDANRASLFITLYRDYPLLHSPYQIMNSLLDIDQLLAQWRNRHMNMVRRMIGHRVGTGGSTGAKYLKGAADKHYVFKEFAALSSFLVERSKLPKLPKEVSDKLSFINPMDL